MSRSALVHRALLSIHHPARRQRPHPSIQSVLSKSHSSTRLSSSNYNNINNPDPSKELEIHLRQLTLLNDGKAINPRSPRQVSTLLYNNRGKGPTDKSTLMKIIMNDNDELLLEEENERQKKVAKLVLKCRELLTLTDVGQEATTPSSFDSGSFLSRVNDGKKKNGKIANFSTVATSSPSDENEQDNMSLNELPVQSSSSYSISPYDQMVMDLFPNIHENNQSAENSNNIEDASLDPYWIEPLLSLTKSSSRSLVRQLQHQYCPMGYDPSASPFSAQLSNTTSTTTDEQHSNNARKRTTSLLSFIRHQKQTHFNEAIMLVRVGDFYETYGIDAIMLVEHCGLNPMAGKARAGCPWRNVQATLDGLTNAGFRVAVYEEWKGDDDEFRTMVGTDASLEQTGNKSLKRRYLAQVVSSANPTYMHGLVLKDDSSVCDDSPASHDGLSSSLGMNSPGRYYVGVIETQSGYTLVEVSAEERVAVVSERLTAEAVSCRLIAYPPADPLIYVPPYSDGASNSRTRSDRLPFLPWRQTSNSIMKPSVGVGMGGGKVRVKTLPPSLVVGPAPGKTDIERAKQTIVSAFLRLEDDSLEGDTYTDEDTSSLPKKRERGKVSHNDFVVITPSSTNEQKISDAHISRVTSSLPLHLETATQLGLMFDPAIPALVSSLLPDSAPSSSRRFLRRWLLIPPPPDIAGAMSQLVSTLKDDDYRALPSINAAPITGKVSSLIRAGQACAPVFRELLSSLNAGIQILLLDGEGDQITDGMVVAPLLKILHYDTGIEARDSLTLRNRFIETKRIIESVVNTNNVDDTEKERISHFGDVIPPAFLERNEVIWRGRVKQVALECSHDVPLAAQRLAETVALDFWGVESIKYNENGEIDLTNAKETKSPIVQDIFNNLIAIKSKPNWESIQPQTEDDAGGDRKSRYFHPRDRNGKVLRTRYTTDRVQEALSDYVETCERAQKEVEKVLTRLSWELVDNGHLPSIMQSSHLNLILSTAAHHAASANMKGWSTAVIEDDSTCAGHFEGVWPYWMDQSESIPNSFDLNGLFLLTAPNMSGKSTLMRTTAAAALLINCGLCAPLKVGSRIRRFDSIFVRGASADVPTEDKSAFGAEMGDVAALLRSCGDRSLVFVDEIGRGTSPKDGTCLAAAILERMAVSGMSGMFATHLHGILNIPYDPLAQARLRKKRMAIQDDGHGHLSWTYKLEDGVCTNSLALLTAAKFGLDPSILQRAEELSEYWNTDTIEENRLHLDENSPDVSMNAAIEILLSVVGKGVCVPIPPSYMPPPSLEGSSCVYILQIGKKFYVGETDSLSQRLSQHRSKGKDWSSLSAVAIQIEEGKSHARNIESLVIRSLAKDGFDMLSVTDGTSIRASSRHGT
ncbi:hypothetical protein ACHAWT_003896 [Skeletonema menzelii]